MRQYILLIQGNLKSPPTASEWDEFFAAAQASGLFKGGSEIGTKIVVGNASSAQPTDHIVAYMRFDSDDKQQLLNLLNKHPVIVHGGCAELCEMPES
jgi:hypothetical protein